MNEKFKALAQLICQMIHEEGILFRPFANSRLNFFSALDGDHKRSVVADLKCYLKICEVTRQQGNSLKDTRILTDQALKQLGLRADELHLDVIKNHHLVEIYNLNHTQIFRSFKFFEVSSYTVEDIYCRKWWNLYERNAEDEALIQKIVADFFGTEKKTLLRVDMPEHFIREKDTLERLTAKTQLLWLIPLYRGKEFAATMAIETSKIEA